METQNQKIEGNLNQTWEQRNSLDQVLMTFVLRFMEQGWKEEKPTLESVFEKAVAYTRAYKEALEKIREATR